MIYFNVSNQKKTYAALNSRLKQEGGTSALDLQQLLYNFS